MGPTTKTTPSKTTETSCSLKTSGYRLTKQCNECPWRKDVPTGRFSPERFAALLPSVEQGFGDMFACHKTTQDDPSACVGYLLSKESENNFRIRMAYARGKFDPSKLEASGPNYESYAEMATANGLPLRKGRR
jgi:hypothetical protein